MSPSNGTAPQFTVPAGTTGSISLIDTTGSIDRAELDYLCVPPVEGVEYLPWLPCYSFLIEGPNGRRILFDAGIRTDWKAYAPSVSEKILASGWIIKAEKSIGEIVREQGYKLDDFEAIVWSHWHWDHLGDPSEFPHSVKIVVGPGFKDAFLPAYPTNKDSPVLETDFEGRELVEIDFSNSKTTIAGMAAFDYFSDGSFYLLNAPGHAIGHLCGLVRTTTKPDTFILLGADAIHHGGELRPSPYLPFPKSVDLTDFPSLRRQRASGHAPTARLPQQCPGHLLEGLQETRGRGKDEPVFVPKLAHDVPECIRTIEKLQTVDWREDVFILYAHDGFLYDIVDMFPKTCNDWKAKGVAERTKWLFLDHILPGVKL